MKVLKFSKDWNKLEERLIPTFRKRCKYKVGEKVKVVSPSHNFIGKVLLIHKTHLKQEPEELLCYDTDTNSKSEALKEIQKFYRNDILDCNFYFILLEKLKGNKNDR